MSATGEPCSGPGVPSSFTVYVVTIGFPAYDDSALTLDVTPSLWIVTVAFSGPGPGSYIDLVVFRRQVPLNGSSAADSVVSAAHSARARAKGKRRITSPPVRGLCHNHGSNATTRLDAGALPRPPVTAEDGRALHDIPQLADVAGAVILDEQPASVARDPRGGRALARVRSR